MNTRVTITTAKLKQVSLKWLCMFATLGAVLVTAVVAAQPRIDATRQGLFTVWVDGVEQEGGHAEYDKALARAANLALAQAGADIFIHGPQWLVTAQLDDEKARGDADEPVPVNPPVLNDEDVKQPIRDDQPVGEDADGPRVGKDPGVREPALVQPLTPGEGWDGPMDIEAPEHEPAIAHWNVVPEQSVEDGFAVGVIAYHLDGVDRVEISANGGVWVTIDVMTVNPRTGCSEYWTSLDLGDHAGPIELRAVIYSKDGQATPVRPIGAGNGEQDLTLYAEPVGEVLELAAGEHKLERRDLPAKGWLTIRPAPGVAREDCIIVGGSRDWRAGRLKIENLTLRLGSGNGGHNGRWGDPVAGHHVWFDNCRIYGNGPADTTRSIAQLWETIIFTDCEISDTQNVFDNNIGLVRNCYIHDVYEDVFRINGLMVNVTIEGVDRDPMVEAQGLTGTKVPHPDLWQRRHLNNTIAQDITAIKNINGQGLFPTDFSDSAFVRCRLATVRPYRVVQLMGVTSNVLIADCELSGAINFRDDKGWGVPEGERLVFEGVKQYGQSLRPASEHAGAGVIIR